MFVACSRRKETGDNTTMECRARREPNGRSLVDRDECVEKQSFRKLFNIGKDDE